MLIRFRGGTWRPTLKLCFVRHITCLMSDFQSQCDVRVIGLVYICTFLVILEFVGLVGLYAEIWQSHQLGPGLMSESGPSLVGVQLTRKPLSRCRVLCSMATVYSRIHFGFSLFSSPFQSSQCSCNHHFARSEAAASSASNDNLIQKSSRLLMTHSHMSTGL